MLVRTDAAGATKDFAAHLHEAGVEFVDHAAPGATRRSRGIRLGTEVAEVLHRLLVDAPLTLDGLDLGSGRCDWSGQTATRGNRARSAPGSETRWFAPLLRTRSGGPFGFLLVDDPVHAFDDLRVDLVSDELVRLARDRRVAVFTHDSRLTEHLNAKIREADVRTLAREIAWLVWLLGGIWLPLPVATPWLVLAGLWQVGRRRGTVSRRAAPAGWIGAPDADRDPGGARPPAHLGIPATNRAVKEGLAGRVRHPTPCASTAAGIRPRSACRWA